MTKDEWTLIAIAMAQGASLSPVQLQKAMFIFGDSLSPEDKARFYEFVPYHYGPFSKDVYTDAELFAAQGLVTIQPGRYSKYAATPQGIAAASRIEATADRGKLEFMRKVVEWVRARSFQEIVRAVYEKWPAFRVNSVFQG